MMFRVINEGSGNLPFDPVRYIMQNQVTQRKSRIGLSFGVMSKVSQSNAIDFLKENPRNRLIHFEAEKPNNLLVKSFQTIEDYIYDFSSDNLSLLKSFSDQVSIKTICPFTARYGQQFGYDIASSFFPIYWKRSEIPFQNRKYDFVYSGTIFDWLEPILIKIRSIKEISSCIISQSDSKVVTHRGVDYLQKMQLINDARLVLVHNVVSVDWLLGNAFLRIVESYRKVDHSFLKFELLSTLLEDLKLGIHSRGGFSNLMNQHYSNTYLKFPSLASNLRSLGNRFGIEFRNNLGFLPQLKSRLFEAAAAGAVPLVITDKWGLCDAYFRRGEEYLLTDVENLADTILYRSKNDKEEIARIGDNARRKWETKYTTYKYLSELKEKFL